LIYKIYYQRSVRLQRSLKPRMTMTVNGQHKLLRVYLRPKKTNKIFQNGWCGERQAITIHLKNVNIRIFLKTLKR